MSDFESKRGTLVHSIAALCVVCLLIAAALTGCSSKRGPHSDESSAEESASEAADPLGELPRRTDGPNSGDALGRPEGNNANSGNADTGKGDTGKGEMQYTIREQGRFRESRFFRAHDMFIAADSPQVVSAADAYFLQDDDEVLGFVIDGHARAYSVRMLAYHHVVNDTIGDTPIAVTY